MPKGLYSCVEKGVGVECEYMLVDKKSLDARPVAEEVFRALDTELGTEVVFDKVRISNESTLHQIEIKTNGPAAVLHHYLDSFQRAISEINSILDKSGCMLLPSAMHPWLKPSEAKFWRHGSYQEVYKALHELFNRSVHGWANLQSTHINLPYENEEEFRLLHSSIRVILPLIPALCASSPFADGRSTGYMDSRLHFYQGRRAPFPSLAPGFVPEVVVSTSDYQTKILDPAYREVGAACPSGVLNEPWINDRGAIGRIDRGTIEIRVLDAQECPRCDLAIVSLIRSVLVRISREVPLEIMESFEGGRLEQIFLRCIEKGSQAIIHEQDYLCALNMNFKSAPTARAVWHRIIGIESGDALVEPIFLSSLSKWEEKGSLAEQILQASRRKGTPAAYTSLAQSLANNVSFSEAK